MASTPSRSRWFLYALAILVFAIGAWYFATKEAPRPQSGRGFRWNSAAPIPVRAVAAAREDFPVFLRAIGTVTPLNTVTVRSRVAGELKQISFVEGQRVERGTLLAVIDPEPYRIQLAQAEAQLRQNQAQLQTVRSDLERFRQLGTQALVTQQQLEAQQALVAEREAAVAADQAQVEDARRQLAYTRIEAPISGRLGLRRTDVGNLVSTNDTEGIVTITQTRPIAVIFTVPEIDVMKVLDPLRAGEPLVVEAWDRNEENLLGRGKLETVDNQIDLATGTLRLKAEFPNQDERLFPNQFVNIRLQVETLRDAVVIPAAAVQFGSRGTYVFTVTEDNKATVRDVVLGPGDGTRQAVQQGLQPGELVVLEGLDRLREGRAVMLVDESAPKSPPPPPTASKAPAGGKKKGT